MNTVAWSVGLIALKSSMSGCVSMLYGLTYQAFTAVDHYVHLPMNPVGTLHNMGLHLLYSQMSCCYVSSMFMQPL